MGRILAIDYGEKRIGLALSDPLGLTAQTMPYCPNNRNFIETLQKLCLDYEVEQVILGLPISMSGQENTSSLAVRKLASELEISLKLPILLKDERLSTMAITKHLVAADVRRDKRKEVVDSLSAAYILQGYLDQVQKK